MKEDDGLCFWWNVGCFWRLGYIRELYGWGSLGTVEIYT